MKEIQLLRKGIFEKPFMDSRVKSRTVTNKELILGHLLGPLGLIFVVNTIMALVEKFFTQQVGAMYGTSNVEMIQVMGGRYGIVMTIAKILAVFIGLFNGWLIGHTKSRQGRLRPWYLIFGFMTIILGCLLFLFPGNSLGESYWYYFFFLIICYNTVGSCYFHLFRDTIVSLTTRNPGDKARIQFVRKMSWTLISGIVIGMLISMVVLPMWLEQDINGYPILMITLSLIAIPLLLLEYFYTKERISEEIAENEGSKNVNNIPLGDQLKALFTNKYFVILITIATVAGIVDNFKGGNVQYFYIKYLLGGAENPMMYTIYQVATGVPLGLGAIVAYPISKKYGIKNVTVVGFAFVLIGSILGWANSSNIPIAMVAGFIRQMGMVPSAYIFPILMCYAYDSIEHNSRLRLEGLMGVAIILAIQSAICAPFAGGYESSILKLGFVDVNGVIPNIDVINFMALSFYLLDIILAIFFLVLLPMVDVEKKIPQINAELLERRKQEMLARGEAWITPEELERRALEVAKIEAEENRIADLKEMCLKKGLSFEKENQKYLKKQTAKEAKAAKKMKNR